MGTVPVDWKLFHGVNVNAVCFDIEICHCVPSKYEPPIPGLKYCRDWSDKAGMGVACIGAYEWAADRFRIFSMDSIDLFRELVRTADLLVSYNGDSFDIPLLEAVTGIVIEANRSYDLLAAIYDAAGGRFKGSGLGEIAKANGLTGKSGDGAMAPVLWQRGKIAELHDYCIGDVAITKKLIDRVLATGELNDPRGGFLPLQIRRPWS